MEEVLNSRKVADPTTVPTILIGVMDHPETPQWYLYSLKGITYAGASTPVERIKERITP